MGFFDCFCAICGASLNGCNIGSRSQKALQYRRRRIVKKRLTLEAGIVFPSDSDEENGGNDKKEAFDRCEEQMSYDPELVSRESTAWLDRVFCLGSNPDAAGVNKAWISGRGEYADQESGGLYVSMGTVLTNSINFSKIDKDSLYDTMADLSSYAALKVDYGNISGQGQNWNSISGEEFSVVHPTVIPGFTRHLSWERLKDRIKPLPASRMDLGRKVVRDPFDKLPYELLHSILIYLPGQSILALRRASWVMHNATRENLFWKMLVRRSMPWFWELHTVIEAHQLEDIDYRRLYLWAETMTRPVFGMKGPFMGIANRRRIWAACEQIAAVYFKKIQQNASIETDETISKHSISGQTPMVSYPQPKDAVNVSRLFVNSWQEVDHFTATFESFWNSEGALVGLGIIFGARRRVFGYDDTSLLGGKPISKSAAHIASNDWIDGLILHIPNLNIADRNSHTAIKGVTIIFKSEKKAMLGRKTDNRRPLMVTKGRCLVGVTGQIGGNGIISRLGLLECPRSPGNVPLFLPTTLSNRTDPYIADSKCTSFSEVPVAQRFLWCAPEHKLPMFGVWNPYFTPVWSHPYIHLLPLNAQETLDDMPVDFAPQKIILWAKDAAQVRKVKRISALVSQHTIPSPPSKEKSCTRYVDGLLGLKVEFVHSDPMWNLRKDKVDGQTDKPLDWPEEDMQHCELDGPNGEYITGVDVSIELYLKAIRLRTNFGRQLYFGKQDQSDWQILNPPAGEVVIGLAIAFRTRDNYKKGAFKMTTAMPLTMKMDSRDLRPTA
ncbi:hypothetical protein PRK78_003766 [Emydomyces testavorans]|uniref:F-box domain-containing protein n=1 Tax=Emydomyces testavorans TaxID=2070801 RepID=A0AAF0DHG2_9EURO|nr:hypothetical protein PRK78_003766 [Emydomyces testavorans]